MLGFVNALSLLEFFSTLWELLLQGVSSSKQRLGITPGASLKVWGPLVKKGSIGLGDAICLNLSLRVGYGWERVSGFGFKRKLGECNLWPE